MPSSNLDLDAHSKSFKRIQKVGVANESFMMQQDAPSTAASSTAKPPPEEAKVRACHGMSVSTFVSEESTTFRKVRKIGVHKCALSSLCVFGFFWTPYDANKCSLQIQQIRGVVDRYLVKGTTHHI